VTVNTGELTMTVGVVVTIDPGTYPATLTNIEDFDYDDGEGKKILRRWTFNLSDELDSEGNPANIDGVSSLALGPKSKAFAWMGALLGRTPEKGEQITRSMLVGRECLVTVVLTVDGYSKIKEVVPLPRKRTAGTSPSAPATAPFPDSPPARLEAAGAIDVDDIPF
jgi:hypothetical protein